MDKGTLIVSTLLTRKASEETPPRGLKDICSVVLGKGAIKIAYLATVTGLLSYLAYVLFTTPQVIGYEVSIYKAYPTVFWVSYFLLYLLAIIALLYSNGKVFRYSALAGLLLPNLSLMLLPLLRGYFCVDTGDTLGHLTYLKHLITNSGVYIFDPYPIPHLLALGLTNLGVKPESAVQIVPVVYYAWYIGFMYLLGKELFKDNRKAILLLVIAVLPVLPGYYFYPSLLFVFMLPSLFYFILKKNWVATIVLLTILPFTHPLSSLLLLLLAGIIGFWLFLTGSRLKRVYWLLVGLFASILFLWLMQNEAITIGFVHRYIASLSSLFSGDTLVRNILQGIRLANFSLGEAFMLYIKRYGALHLLMGIGCAFSIYTTYEWRRKREINKADIVLSLTCLVYCGLYIVSFFLSEPFLIQRIWFFTLVIALLPCVLLISRVIKIKRVVILSLLVVVLVIANFLAVFSLYNSPFIEYPSQQCSYGEIRAMQWLFDNRETELKVYDLNHKQTMIAKYLTYKDTSGLDAYLPPHFGYHSSSPTLGETLGEDCYLIINEKNIRISNEVYPKYEDIWAFNPDDYETLYKDPSLELLYDKDGIKIFFVGGQR